MRHANRTARFWMLGALASFILASNARVHAQAAPVGAPVIKTSGGTAADPIFIDAFEATSSTATDICNRINMAWTAALGSGYLPLLQVWSLTPADLPMPTHYQRARTSGTA